MEMSNQQVSEALHAARSDAFRKIRANQCRIPRGSGIRRRASEGASVLVYQGLEILTLEPGFTPEQLHRAMNAIHNSLLRAQLDAAFAFLDENLVLPSGHVLRKQERLWSNCMPNRDISVFMVSENPDRNNPEQFSAEFRLFPDAEKAHLFMDHGPQWAFKAKRLLSDSEPFFNGPIEVVIPAMVDRFHLAVARHADSEELKLAS